VIKYFVKYSLLLFTVASIANIGIPFDKSICKSACSNTGHAKIQTANAKIANNNLFDFYKSSCCSNPPSTVATAHTPVSDGMYCYPKKDSVPSCCKDTNDPLCLCFFGNSTPGCKYRVEKAHISFPMFTRPLCEMDLSSTDDLQNIHLLDTKVFSHPIKPYPVYLQNLSLLI